MMMMMRKATIRFVISVRLHGTNRLPLEEFFLKISYLGIFRKSVKEIHIYLKCGKNNRYFT